MNPTLNLNLAVTFRVEVSAPRLEALMSLIDDKIQAVIDAYNKASARVSEDVAELKRQIADLKTQVEQGTISPESFAALDTLISNLGQLDPLPEFPAPAPETSAEAATS